MLFRFTGEDRSLQEKTWNYRNLTDLSMTDKQVSEPSFNVTVSPDCWPSWLPVRRDIGIGVLITS